VQGAFTAHGTLWALVDKGLGSDVLTIGQFDGAKWSYHDFPGGGGPETSVLAAAGSTAVVLRIGPEGTADQPVDEPDQILGFAVTTDNGATWSEVVDPAVLARSLPFSTLATLNVEGSFSVPTSMAFADNSTLYVADGNWNLWRSTDFATFSQVSVPGRVWDLKSTGDGVIARLNDDSTMIRIATDGTVDPITIR
jgi:hypothetical protein